MLRRMTGMLQYVCHLQSQQGKIERSFQVEDNRAQVLGRYLSP